MFSCSLTDQINFESVTITVFGSNSKTLNIIFSIVVIIFFIVCNLLLNAFVTTERTQCQDRLKALWITVCQGG